MNIKQIRTRYAPSPTGNFHIGGARTAIFNYLFAKKNLGNFILRIEDTDSERNVENGALLQYNNLKWLNIHPDESFNNPGEYGPYLQSQKILTYQNLVNQLLKQKKAYYCFCSQEELENYRQKALESGITPKYSKKCLNLDPEIIKAYLNEKKSYVVRLNIDPTQEFSWIDLTRNEISVPGSALTDYVIMRANKIPTYNFAVVVDDYDMHITHVLRGDEHISNTPYQIATYKALGWENKIPQYGHLSVIVNETGKKLSKRDENTCQFIEEYKNLGFLPEAVLNFLALLGWAGKAEQEIMSIEEMIEHFDISKVSKSPSLFDYKKLLWISGEYFKKMDDISYWNFVNPFFNVDLKEINLVKKEIALLFKNQIVYAKQLNELAANLFDFNELNKQILIDHLVHLETNRDVIETSLKLLPVNPDEWNLSNLRAYLKQITAQTQKQGVDFFMTLRLVLSYSNHGPELFKVIKIMGYERCRDRLLSALKFLDEFH